MDMDITNGKKLNMYAMGQPVLFVESYSVPKKSYGNSHRFIRKRVVFPT
jgi:hypothetical protein